MTDARPIMTPAIRLLLEHKIPFGNHLYKYEEKGGSAVSSRELKVDEHIVIKTLIMEDENKSPMIVLMHGDCQVSTKQLARELGVKTVSPCDPDVANKHSGYLIGGTSPFGTKKKMPVYIEKTILDLEIIYINGGKRGYLISLAVKDVLKVLNPVALEITA